MKREVWLLRTWFGIVPVNKLLSRAEKFSEIYITLYYTGFRGGCFKRMDAGGGCIKVHAHTGMGSSQCFLISALYEIDGPPYLFLSACSSTRSCSSVPRLQLKDGSEEVLGDFRQELDLCIWVETVEGWTLRWKTLVDVRVVTFVVRVWRNWKAWSKVEVAIQLERKQTPLCINLFIIYLYVFIYLSFIYVIIFLFIYSFNYMFIFFIFFIYSRYKESLMPFDILFSEVWDQPGVCGAYNQRRLQHWTGIYLIISIYFHSYPIII